MKLGVVLLFAALAAAAPRSVNRVNRVARTKTPSYDVTAINDPQNREVVNQDSTGSSVVRAQILLDRAHFSPGEIDGRWGDNFRVAIFGYQAARMINPTGIIDQDTWQSLDADNAPAVVPYTITP